MGHIQDHFIRYFLLEYHDDDEAAAIIIIIVGRTVQKWIDRSEYYAFVSFCKSPMVRKASKTYHPNKTSHLVSCTIYQCSHFGRLLYLLWLFHDSCSVFHTAAVFAFGPFKDRPTRRCPRDIFCQTFQQLDTRDRSVLCTNSACGHPT